MNHDEIVTLCRRGADAWTAHDADAAASLYAQNAVERDAGGETAVGRDAIAARAQRYMDAFPDLRLETTSIEVDGDTFTWEWKASGTNSGSLAGMTPTNNTAVVEGCSVGKVDDDGLIARETAYWNEASMMRQLGLMPEAAAAG